MGKGGPKYASAMSIPITVPLWQRAEKVDLLLRDVRACVSFDQLCEPFR